MAKAILIVESRPSSPDRLDEYNDWYNETHLTEVVALPGFVSAQRYAPADDGPYVAVYEIDADDPAAVVASLGEAVGSGKVQMSDVLQMDPPPSMRLYNLVADHSPS